MKPGDKRKGDSLADKARKEKKVNKGGERLRGFERRLDPERIVGATDSSGELMFLIKVRQSKYFSCHLNIFESLWMEHLIVSFSGKAAMKQTWCQPRKPTSKSRRQ